VDDHVLARAGVADRVDVPDVALDNLETRVKRMFRQVLSAAPAEVVQNNDMAEVTGQDGVDDVTANETRSTRYQPAQNSGFLRGHLHVVKNLRRILAGVEPRFRDAPALLAHAQAKRWIVHKPLKSVSQGGRIVAFDEEAVPAVLDCL
jgi:hypothetical protein